MNLLPIRIAEGIATGNGLPAWTLRLGCIYDLTSFARFELDIVGFLFPR
jgi:hypothetical protein